MLFGNAAFYQYEKRLGRPAIKDFIDAVGTSDGGEFNPLNIKISFFIDVAFCAFIAGGNKQKQPFPYPVEDVAEWLTTERIPDIVEMITDALPKPDNSAEGGEAATPGETAAPSITGNPA